MQLTYLAVQGAVLAAEEVNDWAEEHGLLAVDHNAAAVLAQLLRQGRNVGDVHSDCGQQQQQQTSGNCWGTHMHVRPGSKFQT